MSRQRRSFSAKFKSDLVIELLKGTNFLRPTCSYTECQLSFLTGSMPYGVNSCRLQLLFIFDYLLT